MKPRRSTRNQRPLRRPSRKSLKSKNSKPFDAPEVWHEPPERENDEPKVIKYIQQPAGKGYVHPVTVDEIKDRLELLPNRFIDSLEVVQLSRMTRKRTFFPRYGMQWGQTIYLYPIEESLIETYLEQPRPDQLIEARTYGGDWYQDREVWRLEWTEETIRDFYLNNILIHEIGHLNDDRNKNFNARERFANWFAIEYGYKMSRERS